jgi:hypothetical protein
MKLAQYLTEKNITPGEFGTLVGGVSESGVRKWVYGERTPRPKQMQLITEVTGGLVDPKDFFVSEAAQ